MGEKGVSGPSKRLAQIPLPVNQDEENRKILEGLQMRKTILHQQSQSSSARGGSATSSTTSTTTRQSAAAAASNQASLNQAHQLLAEAHAKSPGFYVFADSKFGNSILAVVPRLKPS